MKKLIYVIFILFVGFKTLAQKQFEIPTIVGEWQHIFYTMKLTKKEWQRLEKISE